MTQIILNIPDQKLDFFLELFEQLGLETQSNFEISQEHKVVLEQRKEQANKEDQWVPLKEAMERIEKETNNV